MSVTVQQIKMPARRPLSTRGVAKYDFDALVAGSDDCIVINDVVNVNKVVSRLTSAVVSFRKRTGCKDKFPVRPIKQADGTDAVGVWRSLEQVSERKVSEDLAPAATTA